MSLESFNFIDSLNASNPTTTDNVSEGDDHIRGIKTTIKNTFPNINAAVTATDEELNLLDGVTATTAELNTLDGITATVAELNILDGVTSTAAELNVLDGITSTVTELNYTDGVTSAIQTQLGTKLPLAGGTMTGNIIMGTSGQGIDFSAATPDGTGTTGSEVLDDYEEGTWTPALYYQNQTGVTLTYTTQIGTYTKVGNLVTLKYQIIVTIAGTPINDNFGIKGSPFAPASAAAYGNSPVSIKNATGSGVDKTWLCSIINTAWGYINDSADTGNQANEIGTGTNVTFRGTYSFQT